MKHERICKRAPNLWNAYSLFRADFSLTQVEIDGEWVPARPLGYDTLWRRLHYAWMVFTGRADALFWPGQE